ncbi:hypothetical protein [Pseudoduganella violaceinigra]|uniref:hypothetical protein n=1 Tax=Pseudoduganella violaceinigra TaxID=246602 RepID=UPI001B7F9171|nr:hypothetical protein [Pseudoduganella violaceinigra]
MAFEVADPCRRRLAAQVLVQLDVFDDLAQVRGMGRADHGGACGWRCIGLRDGHGGRAERQEQGVKKGVQSGGIGHLPKILAYWHGGNKYSEK